MNNRWKILVIVFFARCGLGIQFQTLGALGSRLQDSLSISYEALGWLVGFFMFAGIFLSFPAGLLGRTFSDRKIIYTGLLLLAFGGFIGTVGGTYWMIGFGRVVSGAGFVLGTLYFTKLIGDCFEGRELTTAMGILVMSWPIGIAIAQLAAPYLAEFGGWSLAFYFSSGWCLIGAIAVLYTLPVKAVDLTTDTPHQSVLNLEFDSRAWTLTILAAVAYGLPNAAYVVYLTFITSHLADLGFAQTKADWLASLPSWIMPISLIVAGQWVDRKGMKYSAIAVSSIGGAIALIVIAFSHWTYLGVILFGLFAASAAGTLMSLGITAMPASSRAFGMGVFFTAYFIFLLPAPAIAGKLTDLSGTAQSALAFAALMFVATIAVSLLYRVKAEE